MGVKRIALAQVLIWAASFYSFPALLPHWEADFGWSRTAIAGALTAALLISAGLSPLAGWLIDRGQGRALMVCGALLASCCLALLASCESLSFFYTCWIGLGVAMAASLYDPCFSVITRRLGDRAHRAIITVTLFAGFASSLAFPTAHLLTAWGGWRLAMGFFALAAAGAGMLLAWGIGADRQTTATQRSDGGPGGLGGALRSPIFWLLAVAGCMASLNHMGLVTHLLPLLADREFAPGLAVLAATAVGPMQIAGRVALLSAGDRLSAPATALLSFTGMVLAAMAIGFASLAGGLVAVFVLLQGSAYGVSSIVRPALTARWLGRRGFGAISGALAIPATGGIALAPLLMARVAERGGYDQVVALALGVALCGLVSIATACWLVRRRRGSSDTTTATEPEPVIVPAMPTPATDNRRRAPSIDRGR